jgi:hypothetical protein
MSIGNLTPNHIHQNNIKTEKIMEELLCKKSCYCKLITGLKMSCKAMLGLSITM